MFNFVRLSDGGPPRHEGTRTEVSIIAELGRACSVKTHPLTGRR